MHKYLVGAALAATFGMGGAASAADVYSGGLKDGPVAVNTWTGFYIGAHIGGAWADLKTTDADSYWDDYPGNTPLQTKQSPSGAFGGVQLGYNWQRGAVVVGVETDIGGMGISGSKLLNNPFEHETATVHLSTGLYADMTGRLGYAFGPWMVYGKGGVAWLDDSRKVFDDPEEALIVSFQNGSFGWTAGGGAEYLWSPAWSVKVEYLHFDFGNTNSSLFDGENTFRFDHNLTIDTVKFGLNYHLNGYEPLK